MKKYFIYGFAMVLAGVLFIGFFILDIGINSKYFIEKDFNNAFQYRVTGDCDAFASYINVDEKGWKERCESEKTQDVASIREFKIQNISHKFLSNRAFLQVELTRKTADKDNAYSASYEMMKVGFGWRINQELK